jgi:enediyne biosynthesis protein E4
VTAQAGLGKDTSWSVHAAWLDYNKDGWPDLYVANYLTYDKGEFQRSGAYYKADNYPGPLSYPGTQNRLYRNNGDGTFTDVTQEAGLSFPNGRAMSVVAVDINGDGNTDLFVANDMMPNNLWINDGKGHFTDKAVECGVAFSEGGQGVSNMGPFVGDVQRKGLLDILIPNMRYGTLFCQVSPNRFVDVTAQTGLTLICGQYTGWGGLLLDYDNDGWLDVFVANGDAHHLYTQESVLARNDGHGKFIDVAKESGEYFSRKFVSRGACYGDYDNDGWLDILVFNINDSPCLLHNDGGTGQHWLKVAPLRKDNGQIALHSRVTVKTKTLTMTQPVIGVNGYLVSNDPRAHFGLGAATQADTVEIVWPDGKKQTLTNVPANQILKVRYGDK